MAIVWTNEMNIGIPTIDFQHTELVRLINELEAKILETDVDFSLAPFLERLQQYVLFHFAHEEGMMLRAGLPAAHLEPHFRAHRDFSAVVEDQINQSGSSPRLEPLALFTYLKEWLLSHIQGTDKEFAALMPR